MTEHKKNKIKKQMEIPNEQIRYDPVKVKEHLNKKRKKRVVINNSLTVFFLALLVVAIILLVRFLFLGDTVQIDKDRIFENLQSLYYRNSERIVVRLKVNLLSMNKTAFSMFFTLIIPNFLYFSTGIKELIIRWNTNIYPEQSIKQLWSCIVANGLAIIMGWQQLVSIIHKNAPPFLH